MNGYLITIKRQQNCVAGWKRDLSNARRIIKKTLVITTLPGVRRAFTGETEG